MRAIPLRSPRLGVLALGLALLMATAFVHPAAACSICRCGDPAFNALGLNVHAPGQLRVALDWDRYAKDQGSQEEGRERMTEDRFTLALAYSFSDRVTLLARLPYSWRSLEEAGEDKLHHTEGEGVDTDGLSDPEVLAMVRLWSSPFQSGLGRRGWLGAVVGAKTDWGENNLRRDGERLDEHAQPGTGSTDLVVGLAGAWVADPASTLFGSASYRRTGSNDFGDRYGNVTLTNLGYERRLSGRLDGVLELNHRSAGRDRVDDSGERDPDTGGRVLYLSPKLVVTLTEHLVGRVSVQLPVLKDLYGAQQEHPVYSAGLTYVLGP